METTEKLINQIFENLDKWRKLPAYQLERRADIFFSLYLEKIINVKCDHVIPEFPLKNDDSNKSCKIDYVAVNNENKIVYFIELKTDNGSINSEQWNYLEKASDRNIADLIAEVEIIANNSRFKSKYKTLLKEISKFGIQISENTYSTQIIYIVPSEIEDASSKFPGAKFITFNKIADMLENEGNFLALRFANSLRKWILDPNIAEAENKVLTVEPKYEAL